MTDALPAPWPITVPRPLIALTVAAPAEPALVALRRSLEAEGFRIRSSVSPAGFEAARTSWKDFFLAVLLPQRGIATVVAEPAPDGTVVRVCFPTGGNDWGARQRAVRVLTSAVGALRAQGIRVHVGDWESGLNRR